MFVSVVMLKSNNAPAVQEVVAALAVLREKLSTQRQLQQDRPLVL